MTEDDTRPRRRRLKEPYFGASRRAARVQALWLAFDVVIIGFFIVSPFAARGPGIGAFTDSRYFTVTSLTTTGHGDIALQGFWGRALFIVIRIGACRCSSGSTRRRCAPRRRAVEHRPRQRRTAARPRRVCGALRIAQTRDGPEAAGF